MKPVRMILTPGVILASCATLAWGAGTAAARATPAPLGSQRGTECPTIPWKPLEVAHEVIDIGPIQGNPKNAVNTYKSGGDNEISDAAWPDYVPPEPWVKNSTRNLQFQMSQFIASPGAAICETIYATTSDGYTWGSMSSAINAMWPYRDRSLYVPPSNLGPYIAGNLTLTPPAGDIKITANYKAQNMEFWATDDHTPTGAKILRYFVIDNWGNRYIAHATSAESPEALEAAFDAAVLPEGWKKQKRHLKKDLIIRPSEGSDGSFHYLVLRDSADIGYHQIAWGKQGQLQAQVPDMPIWGGQKADVIWGYSGKKPSQRNIIHGAAGNDRLIPGPRSYDLWGDAGYDTVELPGQPKNLRVISASEDGSRVEVIVQVGNRTLNYTLNYVERVEIGAKTFRTTDFHIP